MLSALTRCNLNRGLSQSCGVNNSNSILKSTLLKSLSSASESGSKSSSTLRSYSSLSKPRLRGYPPVSTLPPLPPPEWEADGSPRRYPLNVAIQEHGYSWEHWHIRESGVYHTIYWGDLAVDYTPHGAWLQSIPIWVGGPVMVTFLIISLLTLKNISSLGIKPKRFTIEWVQATKERERAENSNPVTRYLDRRIAERGHHIYLGDILPHNYYFAWMHNSHDHEWREERGLADLREGGEWSYKPVDE